MFINFLLMYDYPLLYALPRFIKPFRMKGLNLLVSFFRWICLVQVTSGFENTLRTKDSTLQIGKTIKVQIIIQIQLHMKKTKETYFRNFPTEAETNQISGCRQFEGEDLKYDARREFFKNKQKQWLDEQIEQKRQRAEQQKYQNQLYAQQTLELNRMRGMLEDNFQQTKSNIQSSTKNTNLQLDLERKEKQRAEKEARLKYEREEAEYLKIRGAKQDFHMNVK